MQGSVIQAEITEQVRLLKEEWRVTVEKMSKAMAEVRSTLVQAILSPTICLTFSTKILTGTTFWLQNVAH
jgi:aspartate/tyrosine/aromatic aminotransferase